MNQSMQEVLEFVEENDVKFIRLAFCDIFGVQKNISIMASELEHAFLHGVSFDASFVSGFMNVEDSDLLLFPDPATLSTLPWRSPQGQVIRLFCFIRYPDGRPFEGDGRYLLCETLKKVREKQLHCNVGLECEFYLFEKDESGNPTKIPQDKAGYLDIAPLDRGENIRRQICLTLEEMGISITSSHHEGGPGQNEMVFRYTDALEAADNLITFKSVVKTLAYGSGLYASFLPKPLPGKNGSGLHINLSLFNMKGENLFKTGQEHNKASESFIAGILDKAVDMAAFTNPLINSYARLGEFEAPEYVSWSHQNRSQMVRIPAAKGEFSRMEMRSTDPSLNPYLALHLIIEAGLLGIEEGKELPPPCNIDLYEAGEEERKAYAKLPKNLEAAVDLAAESDFIRSALPEKTFEGYIAAKRGEWRDYSLSDDKSVKEDALYFLTY